MMVVCLFVCLFSYLSVNRTMQNPLAKNEIKMKRGLHYIFYTFHHIKFFFKTFTFTCSHVDYIRYFKFFFYIFQINMSKNI